MTEKEIIEELLDAARSVHEGVTKLFNDIIEGYLDDIKAASGELYAYTFEISRLSKFEQNNRNLLCSLITLVELVNLLAQKEKKQ